MFQIHLILHNSSSSKIQAIVGLTCDIIDFLFMELPIILIYCQCTHVSFIWCYCLWNCLKTNSDFNEKLILWCLPQIYMFNWMSLNMWYWRQMSIVSNNTVGSFYSFCFVFKTDVNLTALHLNHNLLAKTPSVLISQLEYELLRATATRINFWKFHKSDTHSIFQIFQNVTLNTIAKNSLIVCQSCETITLDFWCWCC